MPFDLTVDERTAAARDAIRAFVDEFVIPREQQAFRDGLTDGLRRELQAAARAAGVWAPQLPTAWGGGGFRFDDLSVLLEEAGTSLLGPLAINASAPDEGNMHLLHRIGTPEQQQRFLGPLARGEVRSAFAMTEPAPGAGSDPAALTTALVPDGDGWRLSGAKHLITGADGAAFLIVMAAGGGPAAGGTGRGASMVVLPAGTPGLTVGEHISTIDKLAVGGHSRVLLEDVAVRREDLLGEPGEGFRYAQVRLAPARMTHCMRWLGAAVRAHRIALGRAVDRELFGRPLTELGMAQNLIAENEIDLDAARAVVRQTSWLLASGARGGEESSRAKVFVSEATSRVVDRAVQLAGGLGTSEEMVIGRIYADIRGFRIYDGATEAHKMSIARHAARRAVLDGTAGRRPADPR